MGTNMPNGYKKNYAWGVSRKVARGNGKQPTQWEYSCTNAAAKVTKVNKSASGYRHQTPPRVRCKKSKDALLREEMLQEEDYAAGSWSIWSNGTFDECDDTVAAVGVVAVPRALVAPRRPIMRRSRAPATIPAIPARAQDVAASRAIELMQGSTERLSTRPCVKCSAPFALSDGEINFYRAKRFAMPTRCAACRRGGSTAAMRKEKAAQKSAAMAQQPGESREQQQEGEQEQKVARLDEQVWREDIGLSDSMLFGEQLNLLVQAQLEVG